MSGANLAFLLEFGVFTLAALGFGFWQLYSLKKLDDADAAKREAEQKNRDAR
ncbi:MAG: hypothetical protein AAF607_02200 [Pseudomonadota bacterium]